jgi:hypothetical protein
MSRLAWYAMIWIWPLLLVYLTWRAFGLPALVVASILLALWSTTLRSEK